MIRPAWATNRKQRCRRSIVKNSLKYVAVTLTILGTVALAHADEVIERIPRVQVVPAAHDERGSGDLLGVYRVDGAVARAEVVTA